jgi:hypothetical protein
VGAATTNNKQQNKKSIRMEGTPTQWQQELSNTASTIARCCCFWAVGRRLLSPAHFFSLVVFFCDGENVTTALVFSYYT